MNAAETVGWLLVVVCLAVATAGVAVGNGDIAGPLALFTALVGWMAIIVGEES